MTIRRSFSAWWLFFSVPLWLIAINPVLGLVVLLLMALAMLVSK